MAKNIVVVKFNRDEAVACVVALKRNPYHKELEMAALEKVSAALKADRDKTNAKWLG